MADEKVFPFLDLPKELRLMVYESLAVKTVHHEVRIDKSVFWSQNYRTRFTHSAERFLEEGLRYNKDPSDWPVYSIKVVRRTVSGLAILVTCQVINSEAGAILASKLRAISESPGQIIVNSISLGSFDLEDMVTRLSYARTAYWTNKRRLLECGGQAPGLRPKNKIKSRPVHIAIRNSFLDRDTADAGMCEFRMQYLQSYFYRKLHYDLTLRFRTTLGSTHRPFPRIDRRLHVRMSGLNLREKEAYDKVRPLEQTTSGSWGDCKLTLVIDSGEVIGEEEWDKEWAEGER